jgi:5-methyltetrahydrofolate--homocysteine methyltransferase
MEETVNALKEAGVSTKVIIGGAPVTAAYAEKIGAAGYSDDAPGAVALARSLVK